MEKLFITNKIAIKSDRARVWKTLTDPTLTKKYMFGCEAISTWRLGDPLTWEMIYDGKPFIAVKGHVVSISPMKHLSYTVFDPHSSIPDLPQNYLTVTYDLIEVDDEVTLIVTQGDFNLVEDGVRRYTEAFNGGEGWNPILLKIKTCAEEQ